MLSQRWRFIVFFGALTCAIAILANVWLDPHFQFTWFEYNKNAALIAFLMPTIMAVVGLPIAHRGWRLALRLWLAVLAAAGIAACWIILIGSAINGGPEAPDMISTGRYTLAVYGQYGADGVIVDQA